LLGNGKVLVAGGLNASGLLQHASEVYDPARGTWSPAGDMVLARASHSATLLPDGTVLVVGGGDSEDSNSSSELFNPATGTWTRANRMSAPRRSHSATPLPDGRVLVVGGLHSIVEADGFSHIRGLATAEVYDPATGAWSATGAMAGPRTMHTATLLPNGKVLVTGGYKGNGGANEGLATAEVYDPATGTWSAAGAMSGTRIGHTATLFRGGHVLITGGSGGRTAEVYTPEP
jgi:N-acetylneuraminic acid mutarotase